MTNDDAKMTRLAVGALTALLVATGCGSPRDTYRTGQDWQRDACARLPDASERDRCLDSAATSYEEYRRARDAALGDGDGADGVR